MKMLIPSLLILTIVSLATSLKAQSIEDIRWMSEDYPPYNYLDQNGTAQGLAVEVLKKIWDKINLSARSRRIQFLPWARGYKNVLNQQNSALFTMTYTPERLQLFQFVGPIVPIKISVIAPKKSHLSIQKVEDLHTLRIGTIREDVAETLLLQANIPPQKIELSSHIEFLIQKLHLGRVEAISYSFDVAIWEMKRQQIPNSDYEIVYVLKEGQAGYAFHKDVPMEVIKTFQQALDALKTEGVVQQIIESYF